MQLPLQQRSIPRMFVVRPEGLYEGDLRQGVICDILEELSFVLKMRSGTGIAYAVGPRSVIVIKREWLVVPLKKRTHIGKIGAEMRWIAWGTEDGFVPTTRIPFPSDTGSIEAISDSGNVRALSISRIAVIQGRQQSQIGRAAAGGQVGRKDCIHRIILVEGAAGIGKTNSANGSDVAIANDSSVGIQWKEPVRVQQGYVVGN